MSCDDSDLRMAVAALAAYAANLNARERDWTGVVCFAAIAISAAISGVAKWVIASRTE